MTAPPGVRGISISWFSGDESRRKRERVVGRRGVFEQVCQRKERKPCSRSAVERLKLLDGEGDGGGRGSHTQRGLVRTEAAASQVGHRAGGRGVRGG